MPRHRVAGIGPGFLSPYRSLGGTSAPRVQVRRVGNGYIVEFDEAVEYEVQDRNAMLADQIKRDMEGRVSAAPTEVPMKKITEWKRIELYCKDARAIGRAMTRACKALDANVAAFDASGAQRGDGIGEYVTPEDISAQVTPYVPMGPTGPYITQPPPMPGFGYQPEDQETLKQLKDELEQGPA